MALSSADVPSRSRLLLFASVLLGVIGLVVSGAWTDIVNEATAKANGQAVFLSASGPNTTPTPTCGLAWRTVPGPSIGTGDRYLRGVAALAGNNVWAVGVGPTGTAYRTLVVHWDGANWLEVPSPNVERHSSYSNYLMDAAAITPNDVWAVGYHCYECLSTGETLVEHWDGSQWSIIPSPNVGSSASYLRGVAAVSSNDVWAAGYYLNENGARTTLIVHWDGSEWSIIPSPSLLGAFYGVAAISSGDVWAVGEYSTGSQGLTLVEHWDGSQWSVVPSPNPGVGGSELFGVAAVSSDDIWAVGTYAPGGALRTLVVHWDGTSWSHVPSPNSGVLSNQLRAISIVSANDIWAVGDNGGQTLIEHWDGSQWSVVPSPNLAGSNNFLYGVAAVSTDDVWAIGDLEYSSQDLIVRYNDPCTSPTATPSPTNTPTPTSTATYTPTATPDPNCALAWRIVTSPNATAYSNQFNGVDAISANDIWAVGYFNHFHGDNDSETLTAHWDGDRWTIVPSANGTYNSELHAVSAIAPNDVWAVGSYRTSSGGTYQTLIEHWNGSQWSIVPSPNIGSNNALMDVEALFSNDVWAVGYSAINGISQPLVVHWDGTQWSTVSSPTPYNSELSGISVLGSNDIWAVGYYTPTNPPQTLIMHWDGNEWSIVPSPNVGSGVNQLYTVEAISPNDVWAVGYYIVGNQYGTLTEHWDGNQWSVIPSPNVGGYDSILVNVLAYASNDVWAVGYYFVGGNTGGTLIEHWDGTQWSIVPSPNVGPYYSILLDVLPMSSSDAWAVGYSFNGNDYRTLVQRYSAPSCGTPTPTQTPTNTQTATTTPTNTPTPVLVGHVTWQGRPTQPHTLQQLPITLTLKSAAGETNYPIQITDAGGYFTNTLTGLPSGLYLWRVKGPKYLANSGTVALSGASVVSVDMGIMKVGDCNNDNVVNTQDFNILRGSFGRAIGQSGYDDRADLSGDQVVNAQDASQLRLNFGFSGSPPIAPGTR